jgi:hypothetical protein
MKSRASLAAIALLAGTACVDLTVPNPESPDRARALSDPAFVAEAAYGSINDWWLAATGYQYGMLMQGTADALTSSFCYVRSANEEPRIAYNNNPSAGCGIYATWTRLHEAAILGTDLLWTLDNGVLDHDPALAEMARAAALFAAAASHSSLAFAWDEAAARTRPPTTSSALTDFQPYTAVRDTALLLWDDLIALTDGKSWQLPAEALPLAGGAATAARLQRVARTMAARTLVLSARTAAENASTDWDRVLEYAEGGITGGGADDFDFAVIDDYNVWWDYIKNYGNWASWMQVDQRLIHRMAPNIPARFNGLNAQPLPVPTDARLALANLPCTAATVLTCTAGIDADYIYLGFVVGDAARGIWMQSPFWHRRYVLSSFHYPAAVNIGQPLPHVLAAENDLMIAEALVRTGGDLTRAAGLVDKTRVGRGGLTPVGTGTSELLAAIEYERDVELLNTSALALFDRRRVDGLQPLQWRHLPVPGLELQTLGLPIYTYNLKPKPSANQLARGPSKVVLYDSVASRFGMPNEITGTKPSFSNSEKYAASRPTSIPGMIARCGPNCSVTTSRSLMIDDFGAKRVKVAAAISEMGPAVGIPTRA